MYLSLAMFRVFEYNTVANSGKINDCICGDGVSADRDKEAVYHFARRLEKKATRSVTSYVA